MSFPRVFHPGGGKRKKANGPLEAGDRRAERGVSCADLSGPCPRPEGGTSNLDGSKEFVFTNPYGTVVRFTERQGRTNPVPRNLLQYQCELPCATVIVPASVWVTILRRR